MEILDFNGIKLPINKLQLTFTGLQQNNTNRLTHHAPILNVASRVHLTVYLCTGTNNPGNRLEYTTLTLGSVKINDLQSITNLLNTDFLTNIQNTQVLPYSTVYFAFNRLLRNGNNEKLLPLVQKQLPLIPQNNPLHCGYQLNKALPPLNNPSYWLNIGIAPTTNNVPYIKHTKLLTSIEKVNTNLIGVLAWQTA